MQDCQAPAELFFTRPSRTRPASPNRRTSPRPPNTHYKLRRAAKRFKESQTPQLSTEFRHFPPRIGPSMPKKQGSDIFRIPAQLTNQRKRKRIQTPKAIIRSILNLMPLPQAFQEPSTQAPPWQARNTAPHRRQTPPAARLGCSHCSRAAAYPRQSRQPRKSSPPG